MFVDMFAKKQSDSKLFVIKADNKKLKRSKI